MEISGWLSFGVLTAVLLAAHISFVSLAPNVKRIPPVKFLLRYLLLGAIMGIPSDYLFGFWAGLFTYNLGFGPLFIICNGLFSYGLFTIWIVWLRRYSFLKFSLGCVLIGVLYESANLFLGVWDWTFVDNSFLELLLVILLAYPVYGLVTRKYIQVVEGFLQEK